LGSGPIVKVDVANGRVVARRSLGSTPRTPPEHGEAVAVDGSSSRGSAKAERSRRRRLALAYHGNTSGADVIDLSLLPLRIDSAFGRNTS
jgi:hypothetical protein